MSVACTNCFSATEENPQRVDAQGKQFCAACWGAIHDSFEKPDHNAPAYSTSRSTGVTSDHGPFEHMAGAFVFQRNNYAAEVVASPHAIYLLKKAKIVHGITGLLVGDAIIKEDRVYTCALQDLPDPVRAALDPKNRYADHPVIVLHKETVSRVYAKFAGMIVRVGGDDFLLAYTAFSAGRKKRAMEQMGWQLNADLTPTSAPAYDARTPEERAANRGTSVLMKIVLFVLAIILIMVVMLLKAAWIDAQH